MTFTEALARLHEHAGKEFAAKKAIHRPEPVKRKTVSEKIQEDKILKNGLNGFAMLGLIALVMAILVF